MKPFWVYILRCRDGSYYTGHTDNLERRMAQHTVGEIPGCYTFSRRPVTLVYSQSYTIREEALAAERQIKGWSRKKKEAMMHGDWSEVSRLARSSANQATQAQGGRNNYVAPTRQDTASQTRTGECMLKREQLQTENMQVVCYAGYRAEESPVRFFLGDRKVEVREIIDRWLGPDHRYFKVKGDDRAVYILRHDTGADRWELIMFDRTGG